MELRERSGFTVVGVEVVGSFGELSGLVPAAWRTLFARARELPPPPDGNFVEVSLDLAHGYREVLGVVAPDTIHVPEDMHTAYVPGGQFLHHRHEGPVQGIADSFAAMYEWAAQQGLRVGLWRVDAGYRPDGREEAHDLLVGPVSPQ